MNKRIALLILLPWSALVSQAGTEFQASARGDYVGTQACSECHHPEFEAWRGSQHDLAMQPALPETVLGDFDDRRFSYNGVESRFFRDGDRFVVHTDGPDGKLRDYPIAYTFGVAPLQQYLIEFPGGRLQVLGIAWDSRPREQGGQRWFHLYPEQNVAHDHPLHWTRLSQTWNHQCAECHSTDLKKNYDPASHRYATTWQAIDVGCEACHGPGARHLRWARGGSRGQDDGLPVHFDERRGIHWSADPKTGKVRRSVPRTGTVEVELCARCHARRGLLSEDYHHGQPLTQTHRPALLSEGLYYPDGQIEEEDYVYGSFLQSKMFQAGVTCSDCHDPHTLELRAAGNGLCLQCHPASHFETPAHHHHPAGSDGAVCVACHMPSTTYMVVDPRRDHSLRIPRPDLSLELGTPNACNACHHDQSPQWAAEQIRQWDGDTPPKDDRTYARALYEGRRDGPGAARLLNALATDPSQPGIARASAVALLPAYLNQETLATLQQALHSPDALVRMAAVGTVEVLPGDLRAAFASDLLKDPQRAVRIEAARVLVDAPRERLDGAALDAALSEYLASQELNRDRPEALINLAAVARRQGNPQGARARLEEALALERDFIPAYINLADLERSRGNEAQAIAVLYRGLKEVPDSADLHHALGLAQIRAKQREAALASLRKATELDPANARYAFVFGVALHSLEHREEAIRVLESALKVQPTDRDILFTLLQYRLESGDRDRARELAGLFLQTWPTDPRSRQLRGGVPSRAPGVEETP